MHTLKKIALASLLIVSLPNVSFAHEEREAAALPGWVKPTGPWPTVSKSIQDDVNKIIADPAVKKALADLKALESETIKRTITLTEIPAPPFGEEKKAKAFMEMLKAAGLKDVRIDKEGNVQGMRKGSGNGPLIVFDAHLDTVFPLGTDLTVKVKDGKHYGPGFTDDTFGLSTIVSLVKVLEDNKIQTVGDILFLGSVGEEGNGDLRGVKAVFNEYKNIDAFIGLEVIPMGAIANQTTGVHRYEVTFSGPGGHSFVAFGEVPSAINAMGRAIAKIADIKTPQSPRTTYNVGIVGGGRSINTISPDAKMEVDMRSEQMAELDKLDKKIQAMIVKAVDEENKFIGKNLIKVSVKQIGNRPAGLTPNDSPLIQAALGSMNALGQKKSLLLGGTTNSGGAAIFNIPHIQLPYGGVHEGFHALTEGMDTKDSYRGAQLDLLTTLSVVGVKGVSEPAIKPKKK